MCTQNTKNREFLLEYGFRVSTVSHHVRWVNLLGVHTSDFLDIFNCSGRFLKSGGVFLRGEKGEIHPHISLKTFRKL